MTMRPGRSGLARRDYVSIMMMIGSGAVDRRDDRNFRPAHQRTAAGEAMFPPGTGSSVFPTGFVSFE
jgi:hypothetical protein